MRQVPLANIQLLRALAAIWVVMHHALPHYQAMGGHEEWVVAFSQWGFAGVDIFFVISGFIMAYTTKEKPKGWVGAKEFLKHRFLRIYLGYWPFFFLMLLLLFFLDPQRIGRLNLAGSFFLTEASMFKHVLPVAWSLSYELFFYLLVFLTFFIEVKRWRYMVWFVVAGASFLIVHWAMQDPHVPFWANPFLLEFFAGYLIGYNGWLLRSKWLALLVAIVAVWGYGHGVAEGYKNGLLRVASFGVGALGVVWTALFLERSMQLRAGGIMVAIGDASYTLYLSHLFVLEGFFRIGLRDFFAGMATQVGPLLGFLAMIVLAVIFSLWYYRHIESPLYRWALGKAKGR